MSVDASLGGGSLGGGKGGSVLGGGGGEGGFGKPGEGILAYGTLFDFAAVGTCVVCLGVVAKGPMSRDGK